jgi:hypothetical protein
MTTKRSRPDPNSWTSVRLPERDLAELLLEFAEPLLERLGPSPAIDDTRAVDRAGDHVLERERARLEVLALPTGQGAERAQ